MNLKKQRFALIVLLAMSMLMHLVYGLEGEKQMSELQYKIDRQEAIIQDKQEQIEIMDMLLDQKVAPEIKPKKVCLGEFKITHYCPCEKCCGKSDGITFTETIATEGRTIAVDPNVIPLCSTVIIDGHEYIAEDIGGAIKGNRLDIFMDCHQAALDAGVVQAKIYIVEEAK